MDQNLANAADEYLSLREQMGMRKAAAHVMQKFGVTSLALSEKLRDQGALLKQRSEATTTAASEVHYAGAANAARFEFDATGPDSREAFRAAGEWG